MSTGCFLLQPREDIPIEQQQRFVRNAAKSAVFFAIREIHKNDLEAQTHLASWLDNEIEQNIRPILLDPDLTLDQATLDLLMIKLLKADDGAQWAIFIQNALDVFNMYFRTPNVGEIISGDNWLLLVALFDGVQDGCRLVLLTNEEIRMYYKFGSIDGSIHAFDIVSKALHVEDNE
jgi:hypothetical protein